MTQAISIKTLLSFDNQHGTWYLVQQSGTEYRLAGFAIYQGSAKVVKEVRGWTFYDEARAAWRAVLNGAMREEIIAFPNPVETYGLFRYGYRAPKTRRKVRA
jgi:hypothetical protein